MEKIRTTPLQHALDIVEDLSPEDQDMLLEVIRRRRVEKRRNEIALHACDTLKAIQEGCARYGTIDDLKQDLLRD